MERRGRGEGMNAASVLLLLAIGKKRKQGGREGGAIVLSANEAVGTERWRWVCQWRSACVSNNTGAYLRDT